MVFTSQAWDFFVLYFYVIVILLGILAAIVDLLILWFICEILRQWFKRIFKKKGKTL